MRANNSLLKTEMMQNLACRFYFGYLDPPRVLARRKHFREQCNTGLKGAQVRAERRYGVRIIPPSSFGREMIYKSYIRQKNTYSKTLYVRRSWQPRFILIKKGEVWGVWLFIQIYQVIYIYIYLGILTLGFGNYWLDHKRYLLFIIGNVNVTTTYLAWAKEALNFFFCCCPKKLMFVEAWCAPGREISCQRFTSKYHMYDRSSNLVRLVEP